MTLTLNGVDLNQSPDWDFTWTPYATTLTGTVADDTAYADLLADVAAGTGPPGTAGRYWLVKDGQGYATGVKWHRSGTKVTVRLCCPTRWDAICADLTGGDELDTFAEHNTSGHWCSNSNFHDISDGGSAIGDWHVGFGGVLTPGNNYMVYTFTGTFTAGHNYKFGFYYRSDKSEAATCYFGASDTGCAPGVGISCFTGDKVSLSITPDGTWHHYEMTWTPATTIVSDGSNGTAIGVRWGVDATGSADGLVLADGGTLCEL